MLRWMKQHGTLTVVGVEGCGIYGAGLARHLDRKGIAVVEVPRPDRRLRRNSGKSDPIDAEAAARAVLAGTATVQPKLGDGPIEAIRALRVARIGAVKAKTAATNALKALVITAPEPLRSQLAGLTTIQLVNPCARFRSELSAPYDPTQATKTAMRSIAVRARHLIDETRALKRQLDTLTQHTAPATTSVFAIGPETAAALLVTIGDNPDRLRSEAAFAHLCGVAPIPASLGKTDRHRSTAHR
jgi:transposase